MVAVCLWKRRERGEKQKPQFVSETLVKQYPASQQRCESNALCGCASASAIVPKGLSSLPLGIMKCMLRSKWCLGSKEGMSHMGAAGARAVFLFHLPSILPPQGLLLWPAGMLSYSYLSQAYWREVSCIVDVYLTSDCLPGSIERLQ
jgi:hypothetical protein